MDALTHNQARMQQALALCREYMHSDAAKAYTGLLESLIEHYSLELEVVTAEQLPRVQGALRQVGLLSESLTADIGELPRI